MEVRIINLNRLLSASRLPLRRLHAFVVSDNSISRLAIIIASIMSPFAQLLLLSSSPKTIHQNASSVSLIIWSRKPR